MVHKKLYISEMIVNTEKDLSRLFAPLSTAWEQLHALAGTAFQPAGIRLGTDPAATGGKPAAFFIFEREAGKPYAQGRYYTSSPLRTGQHEEVLQQLEILL
jgi:hypothetical protein